MKLKITKWEISLAILILGIVIFSSQYLAIISEMKTSPLTVIVGKPFDVVVTVNNTAQFSSGIADSIKIAIRQCGEDNAEKTLSMETGEHIVKKATFTIDESHGTCYVEASLLKNNIPFEWKSYGIFVQTEGQYDPLPPLDLKQPSGEVTIQIGAGTEPVSPKNYYCLAYNSPTNEVSGECFQSATNVLMGDSCHNTFEECESFRLAHHQPTISPALPSQDNSSMWLLGIAFLIALVIAIVISPKK